MDQVAFLHSCSLLCLAVALAASCFTCLSGNRPNSGTSAVVVTSCLLSCSVMWSFPYYVVFGITVATVGISLSSLHSSLQSLFHQKEATTMPAATLLWKVVCAMLKRGELGQAIVCLIWGVHCFITHVLLELEDLVLDLAPQWQGEVFVILGHPRSASTHVHHMLSQTLPSSASLSFYDVLFPSLIQWYCMQPFKPLVDIFLSLLDSPQHRIAVDEVAEEQQWLLLKFKDILLPMLFPAMVDDPELFRASCDYTEADMMFIKGCMRRLLIRKPQSKLYIARMLTFSPWPEYVTTAFPDAKFIVCLRETEECLRSFVSLAAVHSGGNPNTPLCKKWAQNCADTLTKGTVRGLQRLVDGQVPAESVMQVNFKSWKAETRASLIWLLKELGMHEELKAVEGSEEVKVERREQHKSSPDVTDCLEGVDIANWAIDEMNSMIEKLKVF
ncbi:PLSCR2 [Symbiodinium sp. CCMP2592]|nr:PLSCR2 [Symbiodinium sp. CCMP2592]